MNKRLIALLTAAGMSASVLSLASFADEIPDRCFPMDLPKAYKVPVIDGKVDPDEGWGSPIGYLERSGMTEDSGTLNGDMDADEESFPSSITIWYRWDETYLYFASEVVEDIHENFCDSPDNASGGDGYQFDIATDFDRATRDIFFVALSSEDGNVYAKAYALEDGAPWDENEAPGTYVITRDEANKLTTYEFAVPWADAVNTEWKAELGAYVQLRPLLLCNPNDVLDINVAGSTEDGLAFWYMHLVDYSAEDLAKYAETEAPAPEAPAETEAPAPAETAAQAPAETAAPVAETAAPVAAAAPAAAAPAAQTGDTFVIAAAVLACAAAAGIVISRKKD